MPDLPAELCSIVRTGPDLHLSHQSCANALAASALVNRYIADVHTSVATVKLIRQRPGNHAHNSTIAHRQQQAHGCAWTDIISLKLRDCQSWSLFFYLARKLASEFQHGREICSCSISKSESMLHASCSLADLRLVESWTPALDCGYKTKRLRQGLAPALSFMWS